MNKPSIEQHLNTQKKNEMAIARTALDKVFRTVNLLGRQGLALRGHDKDTNSNIIQILKVKADDDSSELQTWLKRSSKWLSHKIIRGKLELIKSCIEFAIILDETADISQIEKITVCPRMVLTDSTVQEISLEFYATDNTKSETLFKIVEDIFTRFGFSFKDLRGNVTMAQPT